MRFIGVSARDVGRKDRLIQHEKSAPSVSLSLSSSPSPPSFDHPIAKSHFRDGVGGCVGAFVSCLSLSLSLLPSENVAGFEMTVASSNSSPSRRPRPAATDRVDRLSFSSSSPPLYFDRSTRALSRSLSLFLSSPAQPCRPTPKRKCGSS